MITLLLIYIASFIGAYLTVRKTYNPGGEWEALNPGRTEFMLIFVPGTNTFISLVGIVGIVVDWIKSLNIKINYTRFFHIKK